MKKILLFIVFMLTASLIFPQTKKIKIIVDERIELISTMQLLFDYPLVGKADIKYKNDVLTYFDKYKEDSSVFFVKDLSQKNFGFGKPFNFSWHYTFPDFKQIAKFTDYENKVLGFAAYGDSLQLFITALKQFYKKSGFHGFYKKQKLFYDTIIASVSKTVHKIDLTNILEKHYGAKQYSYTLVLSPLFIEAGTSITINTNKGNALYSVIGPNLDSKVIPDFDDRWLIQNLVLHEFSHAFCNPLIEKYYNMLEKDSCLFNPIQKAMKQQACKDWKSTLCEMWTRANEIALVEKIFGKEDADKVYNDYMGQKWIYIKGLIPIVKEYQENRGKYKTLEDIMPEVISYFDGEAKNCH